MEHTKLVTPSELEDFADRRDSEPIEPELVATLVSLSVPDLTLCRIPYGDSIGLPGLDGMVQTEGGFRQFVPKQTSYWEISRGADARGKATENYTKRTEQTSVADRANITFVFVTPRSKDWDQPSQAAWIQKRQADGWKEIKIIDGVQLCDWLRDFPGVGKWLLQRMGLIKALTGFETPAEHWSYLAQMLSRDDPPLPPQIFLVGRENACQQLERVFRQEAHQLILSIESENDAEDFVAAFLESLAEPVRHEFSRRCLFISDPEAWHTFSNLRFSHVLVASPRLDLADSNEQLHLAARAHGHGIIFSVSGAWSRGAEKLVPVMSPSRSLIEKTLVDSGFRQERAIELASAGAQSLAALKRFLRGLGDLPPYATWDNARVLAQASLIGKWKGGNAADREAVEILLGKSYREWIGEARAETLRAATPLIQRNEGWKIISRGEAWSALGPRITDEDLERFQKMALQILSEKDPQFELAKDERYSASIHGKVLAHSRSIREGVVESLALLGVKSNALSSVSAGKAEGTATLVVRKLLHKADWQTWASLNSEMPLLAEAAPNEFLDAVEAALVDPTVSPFIEVFRQEGSASQLDGWNYITGVLWALETLAWHPDYLGRATLLLGDLAAIDPGGSWSNRPLNSLVDIFLPWLAHTVADLPVRRAALESLLREHSEIGWKVLVSLLPNSHGVTAGTRKPVWRSFIPLGWSETVTHSQYWAQVQVYAEMCTQIAAGNIEKLGELVDRLVDLPEPAHSQVLNHLSSPVVTSLSEADRLPLWEALMDLALKHRRFADAQWAMPMRRIEKIEEVANKLTPSSELSNRRLFTERDGDLYTDRGNFEQQRQRLEQIRQDAIKAILVADGVDGVIRFAQTVDSPRKAGAALGAIADPKVDAFLLPGFLEHGDTQIKQFLGSFVWRRFWTEKWAWVDQQLSQGWRKDQVLAFLLLIPSEKETWRRAEKILGDEAERYWQRVEPVPWYMEPDDLLEAAEKLTTNGQPASAVECLYVLTEKKVPIPMRIASAALLGLLDAEEQQKKIDQYHITEVIKWLQVNAPIDSDDLFKIEWHYLPLLNHPYGGEAKVLEHRLASSPVFFCEVIGTVFRSDTEDKEESKIEISAAQKRIVQNAYSLLHGWHIVPGVLPDGSFDGDKFTAWLEETKRRCKESGHFRVAMVQLGQALTHAPQDPGGLWIHKSIATALDARDVPEMRRGFTVGLFNRRGVFGFTHGEEERKLASDYRAKAKALSDNGFHRVADAVRSLADDYERDAERESRRDIFDDR